MGIDLLRRMREKKMERREKGRKNESAGDKTNL
jgi:hypothetical protein